MRELLRWLFNISGKELDLASEMLSKDTAKQRLKLVLIQDRLELAPEKLEEMKKEIWEVVSKFMVVDDDFMEFDVRRVDDLTVLVSNIEVKDLSDLTPALTANVSQGEKPVSSPPKPSPGRPRRAENPRLRRMAVQNSPPSP